MGTKALEGLLSLYFLVRKALEGLCSHGYLPPKGVNLLSEYELLKPPKGLQERYSPEP